MRKKGFCYSGADVAHSLASWTALVPSCKAMRTTEEKLGSNKWLYVLDYIPISDAHGYYGNCDGASDDAAGLLTC